MGYSGMNLNGELMIVDREGNKQPLKITSVEFSPISYPEITGYLIGSVSKRKSGIKGVIFNNPATVVIWEDGTKTVVKCQKGDTYSEELGLAMCIAKKFFGNKGNFNEVFKKWLPKEPEKTEISIEKMRVAIRDYCHGRSCDRCKIYHLPDHIEGKCWRYASPEEVVKHYRVITEN